MSATALIALDWGSSQLRACRLDAAGAVQERRISADGASRLTGGARAFEAALRALVGDWMAAHPEAALWACGMVGSAHGWLEVPYAALPADVPALAAGRRELALEGGRRLCIAPGARTQGRHADVMRGEETQLTGLLADAPALAAGCQVVLPGTHSKWVEVRQGQITRLHTVMTGELYALLRQHSVLSRLMPQHDAPVLHEPGFDAGVAMGRDGGCLSRLLFSVRTQGLFATLPPEALPDYLSGLLIAHELADALGGAGAVVVEVIGEPRLCLRYQRALAAWGVQARCHEADLAARGLWALHQAVRD